jgi:hypothetical protein
MRQALGTVVFFGMLGVTFFGLMFTPVFFYVIRRLTGKNVVPAHGEDEAKMAHTDTTDEPSKP